MGISRSYDRNGSRSLPSACAGMKSEAGTALVELAIAAPLLLLLLLGAVGMATVIYDSIAVENAAMAGVQYGAKTTITAADTTGIQNAAAAAAPSLSLTTTPSTSCICSDGASSACQPTDCPNGASIETILTVSTQVTVTPSVYFPGLRNISSLPKSYTLHGQAIQKVLQ
jgi:Flp pilus assembly protein TadG